MTTITDQLEGLLPADGPATKDDRVIAEAVGELRTAWADIELIGNDADMAWNRVGILQDRINRMGDRKPWKLFALGAASGIALAVVVVVGVVW